MPISVEPVIAEDVAAFGQGASKAASINYDVPLPGAYSFERIIPLGIADDAFTDEALGAGRPLSEVIGATETDNEITRVGEAELVALYTDMLTPYVQPMALTASTPWLRAWRGEMDTQASPEGSAMSPIASVEAPSAASAVAALVQDQVAHVERGPTTSIRVPAPGVGRSIRAVEYDTTASIGPRIALVETWQLSSFLGDYGLGRTLQTFSLLPGERTTITVETWRTEASTREEGSSIFDSADSSAESRFTEAVERQTGSAFQDQGGWALSLGAKASASGNIGIAQASVSVEAGFNANHQEARQEFANSVAQSGSEHADQVNTSRQQSVQSSSTATSQAGTAETTLREISNTNLRRVLNFVFRELNQKYTTVVSLRDVRLAFYNGKAESAEVVPLPEMRALLSKYVVPAEREPVARAILRMVAESLDYEDGPQTMLQVGTREGGVFEWENATLTDDGEIAFDDSPLDNPYLWRIIHAPIGQTDDQGFPSVPGVVTEVQEVVLRTDTLVVEALLGQADALDPYATQLQALDLDSRQADIDARKVDTDRIEKALEIIDAQTADDQPEAFERMLGDHPDITVVPAAAVADDNTPNP
jgi:hypothetical protein